MAGSSDDEQCAPESWELADVEESMRRLLQIKNKKNTCSEEEEQKPSARVSDSASSSNEGGEDARLLERINQVDQFLRDAIQNPRERLSVLRLEQDVERFLHNPRQQQLEFCQLPTSYLRLAAHRIAQHYSMQSFVALDHNSPDGSAVKIIVTKTPQTRPPSIRLADIPVNLPQDQKNIMMKVAIKQRPQRGSISVTDNSNVHSSNLNQMKSVEERKEEYIKARARIFSANVNSNVSSKSGEEPGSFENYSSPELAKTEEKSNADEVRSNQAKGSPDGAHGVARTNKFKNEKEGMKPKGNRVAIFRDREMERKDPDYDRSYERYTQRFDPGFGFNIGPYSMHALYTPPVNYNTEFPQLGAPPHRAQMPIEPSPRPMAQQMQNPWCTPTSSMGYSPLDATMAPFNTSHMGGPSIAALYMHSSQFPGTNMTFVQPQEPIQQSLSHTNFQQQHEVCYNQVRPSR